MWDQLDLFAEQKRTLSVTEITRHIRNLLEGEALLQNVWVEGEISNLSRASSGHVYLILKDNGAQIGAVIWRSQTSGLRIPASGDQVVAHGRIGLYPQGGRYQLYIDAIEPAGRGALYMEYERLKLQLEQQGLFSPEHKRPLPFMPQTIGVVTSPGAAALRDVMNVLNRRFPQVRVILSPTLVQGTTAPPMIVQALDALNERDDIDLILLVRGGGSLEDLWAFNDEKVARAVYDSRHPILTGIGHETDFSLADFTADRRAPTPSAAAELAVPDVQELRAGLVGGVERLNQSMLLRVQRSEQELAHRKRQLVTLAPIHQMQNTQQRLDDLLLRLQSSMQHRAGIAWQEFKTLEAKLSALNPEAVLGRGYALVTEAGTGELVSSVEQVSPNLNVNIRLSDGEVRAVIRE